MANKRAKQDAENDEQQDIENSQQQDAENDEQQDPENDEQQDPENNERQDPENDDAKIQQETGSRTEGTNQQQPADNASLAQRIAALENERNKGQQVSTPRARIRIKTEKIPVTHKQVEREQSKPKTRREQRVRYIRW